MWCFYVSSLQKHLWQSGRVGKSCDDLRCQYGDGALLQERLRRVARAKKGPVDFRLVFAGLDFDFRVVFLSFGF